MLKLILRLIKSELKIFVVVTAAARSGSVLHFVIFFGSINDFFRPLNFRFVISTRYLLSASFSLRVYSSDLFILGVQSSFS